MAVFNTTPSASHTPYPLPPFHSSVFGTENDPDYNTVVLLPAAINDAAVFFRGILEAHWESVASTLHKAFLAGETGSAHIVVITWDASVHGWGAVIRWWANRDRKVIVGSLPSSPDMLRQVRRETLAGVLSFEAADRLIDLSDATIILRNDAVGALAAFRKLLLHLSSVVLDAPCSGNGPRRASLLCLHAPGLVLIDEGVDSLDATADVTGPATVTDPRCVDTSTLSLHAVAGTSPLTPSPPPTMHSRPAFSPDTPNPLQLKTPSLSQTRPSGSAPTGAHTIEK